MVATAADAILRSRADTDPSPPSRQDMVIALGIPAFIVLCIGAALIHFIYRRVQRKEKAGAGQAPSLKHRRNHKEDSKPPSEKNHDVEAGCLEANHCPHMHTEPGWVMVVGGGEGIPSGADGPSPNHHSPTPPPAVPSPPASSDHLSLREPVSLSEISPPPSAMVRPRSSLGTNYSYYNWTSAASDAEETFPDRATETTRSRASRVSDPFSNRSTALDHDEPDCASDSGTMSTLPPSYRTQRATTTPYHQRHALPPPPPISSSDVNPTSPPSAFIARRRISGMFGPRPNVRSSLGQVEPDTPSAQGSASDAPHTVAGAVQDTRAAGTRSNRPQGKRGPRRKSVDGGVSLAGGPPQELPPSYNGPRAAKSSEGRKGRTVRTVMT
ncbi:hypothetical protein C8Q73DRAFT_35699 [Cubamyces lactineus]|nr:hypothetical protein C8Q73DRAFT_35699 [Cubamyces lactineus]